MDVIIIIFIVSAAAAAFYLYLVFPTRVSKEQREIFANRCYAHRALYDNKTDRPENSLPAFEAAMRAGYGCELDVQFTKDKKLIVFHDNDFLRSSGVDKKVWELTYDEIKQIKLFESSESVPLFSEVLSTINGREPLIVEIKAEQLTNEWYSELCDATLQMLRGYRGDFCVESFHPVVVRWFKKNAPDVVRGQLVNARRSSPNIDPIIVFPVEQLITGFLTRPHYIAYKEQDRNLALRIVQKLGAMSVMWTVRTQERQNELCKAEDAIIFESYTPAPFFNKHG
ncbi:MAG: glycerophosphodiester phosphodiesterase family protein [Oscillospiraceae bacterium]